MHNSPDFLNLDAGPAVAHEAVRRKALRHGPLRDAARFAERFAKRAKPDICSLAEGPARESLAGRAFAPRSPRHGRVRFQRPSSTPLSPRRRGNAYTSSRRRKDSGEHRSEQLLNVNVRDRRRFDFARSAQRDKRKLSGQRITLGSSRI